MTSLRSRGHVGLAVALLVCLGACVPGRGSEAIGRMTRASTPAQSIVNINPFGASTPEVSSAIPMVAVGAPPDEPPLVSVGAQEIRLISYRWYISGARTATDVHPGEHDTAASLPHVGLSPGQTLEMTIESPVQPVLLEAKYFRGLDPASRLPVQEIQRLSCPAAAAPCRWRPGRHEIRVAIPVPTAARVAIVALFYAPGLQSQEPRGRPDDYASFGFALDK